MKFHSLVGAVLGVAVCATVSSAQVCQGDLSFRGSSKHIGGALGMSDNATSFGGGLSVGHSQGWYGGGSLGVVSYDPTGSAIAVGGGLGYAMPMQKSKWQVCPGGTLTLGFGPNFGPVHGSSQTITMGASFGTAMPLTKSTNLLPFGSVAFGHTRFAQSGNGNSSSLGDSYILFGAGAGFQLTPSLVLRPALSLAAAADYIDDTSFSFGITFALPH
ncbi:MAG: hypothetical protein ACJ8AK_03225 [Gemmatimonadaceae bacterium]